jgi:hypothetical protein
MVIRKMSEESNNLKPSFGWRYRKPDPRDFDIKRILKIAEPPPESFDCRTIGNVGPILQQTSEGSCVGQAGAGIKSGMEKASGSFTEPSSARCCYNGAKWVGGYLEEEGAYSDDLMKFLLKYGPCRESLWPYRAGVDSSRWPPPSQAAQDDMMHWKIKSYYRINIDDRPLTECITLLKQAISQRQHGIYLAIPWPYNWMTPIAGKLPVPSGGVAGGHAIHIVAYDTAGFVIQNSWGSIWGPGGCAWAPWSSFNYFIAEGGFDLMDTEDAESPGPEPPDPDPEPGTCESNWEASKKDLAAIVAFILCWLGITAPTKQQIAKVKRLVKTLKNCDC